MNMEQNTGSRVQTFNECVTEVFNQQAHPVLYIKFSYHSFDVVGPAESVLGSFS